MNIFHITPSTIFNNHLYLNKVQEEIYIRQNVSFKDSCFFHNLCSEMSNAGDLYSNYSFFKKSFLYIITETTAEYPYPYFTEKTWKAILYKMPFVIVGSKHSLKQLNNFGFKTFNQFWNEEYDNFEYAADRIDAIIDIVSDLSKLKKDQIDNLYNKMLPLLDHNQQQLKNLYTIQLNNIKENLKTL